MREAATHRKRGTSPCDECSRTKGTISGLMPQPAPRWAISHGNSIVGDDAAERVRGERQVALVAVERREPGARVGQADAGAKTLRKSDSVVDRRIREVVRPDVRPGW